MHAQKRPESQPAVIYDQNELYDFAISGGSVAALIEEQFGKGNRVIISGQIQGRPGVVMMLERMEDISRWEDYRHKLRDWRDNVVGNPAIEKRDH